LLKNKPKKKIVFFSSKIDSGGAEKHLVRLINALANKSNLELTLIVTVAGGNYESLLNPTIRLIPLLNQSGSYTASMVKAFLLLKKQIKEIQPDLIFSIQDGPNVVMLMRTFFSEIPVIIGVQNNPIIDLNRTPITKAIKWIATKLYPRAKHMIALSAGVASDYLHLVPKLQGKLSVVPNVGWPENVKTKEDVVCKKPIQLLAVGRLEEQKDYATFFNALALLKQKNQSFKLTILGRGAKEEELKDLRKELNLEDEIVFKGFTSDVSTYFYNSDIFVLSSKWEGFGNVIVEAMAHGLPVISSDCPHGPSEIIENRKNGLLFEVGNALQLSEYIQELTENELLRKELMVNGLERANMFKPEKIAEKYYEIFDEFLCVE